MTTRRPRIGRPPLDPKRPAVRVNLVVAAADLKRWNAAADREGQSLSEWLRAAAEGRL